MRECDLVKLPDGALYGIFQITPEDYDIGVDDGSISVDYKVIVGGPNPQNYREQIWDLIAAYSPQPGTKQVLMPGLGDVKSVRGRYFISKNLKLKIRRESDHADCRVWRATVTWEVHDVESNPEDQNGVPVTEQNIKQAQATIRVRPGSESQPVEHAQFFGFFDGTGLPKTCTWIDSDYVCQPLRDMTGKHVPVMNSAGVRFDPGLEMDSGVDRLVISKPYSMVPFGIQKALRNKINCDRFFILEFRNGKPVFGVDVAPYTARVTEVTHTFEQLANGFEYPVLHVELAIRNQRIPYLDEFGQMQYSDDFGWCDLIANRGTSMLAYPGRSDYNGGVWPNPPDQKTGGRSNVPITRDGQLSEPQWLDCNGLPIIDPGTPDPETCALGVRASDITYLCYVKYQAIKFASANFPGFLGNCFFNTQSSGVGSLPAAHFPDWAGTQDLTGTVLESLDDFIDCT